MQKMPLKQILIIATLLSPFAAAEASAKIKEAKIHFITPGSAIEYPEMEMAFDKGWKWIKRDRLFKPRMKLFFRSVGSKIDYAKVYLEKTNHVLWALPAGYKTRKYEKVVTASVGKQTLSSYKNLAINTCKSAGGDTKVIRKLGIKTKLVAAHNLDINDSGLSDAKHAYTQMPLKIVCHGNNEGGTYSLKLKVKKIELYTDPSVPQCGKPVKMITKIHTNRPGKVNFLYVRGNGDQQKASVTTKKKAGGFFKTWIKTYKFSKSTNTNRKYVVSIPDHNIATKWVPLIVNCSSGATTLKN
ncbi:MAG: hypothetical protein ABJN40_09750 [Sneathiella sp.]